MLYAPSSLTPCPNTTVWIDATSGYVKYIWNFGDGSPKDSTSGYYPSHTYTTSGTYSISVKIYDDCGKDTTLHQNISVGVFFAGQPTLYPASTTVCLNTSVNFSTTSGYPTYVWNYGDGTSPYSGSYSVSHSYSIAGTYTASVKISDNCGHDTTLYSVIGSGVFNGNPTISASPNKACANASISFLTGWGYSNYLWNFGDGSAPLSSTSIYYPSHTYTVNGNFTASVTITDNCGVTKTLTTVVSIGTFFSGNPIPINISQSPTCPYTNINLNTSSGYSSYTWNFGDGTTTTNSGYYLSHTYTAYGTYSVSVDIHDNCGHDTILKSTVNVQNTGHFIGNISPIYASSTTLCPNTNMNFQTTYGFPIYVWNYGDGKKDSIHSTNGYYVTHTYTAYNTYTLSTTVYDNCGNDTTLYQIIHIVNSGHFSGSPTFNTSPTSGCPNSNISFSTNSGFPIYVWKYGDGKKDSSVTQYTPTAYSASHS
ncbi:MAG TPA: PKD domain-containing protein, partial [Bacteroidia bacterium]